MLPGAFAAVALVLVALFAALVLLVPQHLLPEGTHGLAVPDFLDARFVDIAQGLLGVPGGEAARDHGTKMGNEKVYPGLNAKGFALLDGFQVIDLVAFELVAQFIQHSEGR